MISFRWFLLGVVSWMIFINNVFTYSISNVSGDLSNLLTVQFCLNCRVHPVILCKLLYVNMLVMLVVKWFRLSSMDAMATMSFSSISNVSICVFLVPTTIGCVGQSSLIANQLGPSYQNFVKLGPSYQTFVKLSALISVVSRSIRFSLVGTYFQFPFDNAPSFLLPVFWHKQSMNSW